MIQHVGYHTLIYAIQYVDIPIKKKRMQVHVLTINDTLLLFFHLHIGPSDLYSRVGWGVCVCFIWGGGGYK